MAILTTTASVNDVLQDFKNCIQAVLGNRFLGMYLYGSLALGDFDPQHSDIDFCVVTDGEINDDLFISLKEMHADFDESGSPWSSKVEAAYIPRQALNHSGPTSAVYPQIEKGGSLSWDHIEPGWVFQRYTLRHYGVVVFGPAPADLIEPVDPRDMRVAALSITGGWLEQSRRDPAWLAWLRLKEAQSFVALTLCRLLYTLDTGAVVSKPIAARWAQAALDRRWSALIKRSITGQHDEGQISDRDLNATLDLIQYTFDRCQT